MADAPNTNDELYPIAVLIDELKVMGGHALSCVLLLPLACANVV